MIERGRVVACRYRIEACLGEGGMGTVYRARDLVLDEDVALKVLHEQLGRDPTMARRFLAEIKLARKVTHPNVCRIYEYGEDGDLRYISMELVDGIDLRRLVKGSSGLPAPAALDLVAQAAEGLQAIHDVGIIHRDLKTANLMRDGRGRVRLMDFGIAKLIDGKGGISLSAPGSISGTPEYMSPEQARAEKLDERSDIYSLGVVLFELLTGSLPFRGATPLATVLMQIQAPPPLDGDGAAGIPDAVRPLLRRALQKDPRARFQAAREMAAALRAPSGLLAAADVPPASAGPGDTMSLGAATEAEARQITQPEAAPASRLPPHEIATQALARTAAEPGRTAAAGEAATAPASLGTAFVKGALAAGRYRIVRFLAQGGMGEVYEAYDLELGGRVALKTVKAEIAGQRGSIDRFKREIAIARKVTHPGVCRIFDLGSHRDDDGSVVTFLTMELLSGETLSQRIRARGRLETAEALPLVMQMAAALDAAHDAGIVHRDFKSSNVMLVAGPSGERAVVTDLGLARAVSPDQDSAALTGTGDVVGSPAYMAPEQVAGGTIGHATDVYALGVVLFEMVTGRWPFVGDTPLTTAARRLTEPPPSPKTFSPQLDSRWTDVILRCLEREPAARFQRAGDVARALQGELPVAAPRRMRRWLLPAALAAAAVAGGVGSWVLLRSPQPASTGIERVPVRRAVAVLGFRNLAGPEGSWLSTAVAEMLRSEIGAGESVRTVPGDAVGRARLDLALPDVDRLTADVLAQLRQYLGVDLVVLGSYLVEGTGDEARVRLDLNVQDTTRGTVVSAASVTGTKGGLFDLVSKAGASVRASIGLDVASALDAAAARAARPSSPEAARLYAEGLTRLRVFDAQGATRLLEQAVAADPQQPLAHSSLATAWSALGYDAKARDAASRAADLSAALPREDRLVVEGLKHETSGDWKQAADAYKSLFLFFPDRLDFGLRLAAAQTAAGQPSLALSTVNSLRQLPPPLCDDARIDLAESAAAKGLTDYARQRAAAARAATKAQAMGSRLLFAQARLMEARAAIDLHQFDAAVLACDEARKVFESASDVASLAQTENTVGLARAMSGNAAEAKARFEAALADFRRIGHERGVAQQLLNLGNVAADAGDPREAARLYGEAVAAYAGIADRAGVGRAANNLGTLLWEARDPEGAIKAYEQALVAWRDVGETRSAAEALFNIGEALQEMKRYKAARPRFEEALQTYQSAGDTAYEAETLMHLGEIELAEGHARAASRTLEESITAFRSLPSHHEKEPRALRALARAQRRLGGVEAAKEREAEAARLEAEAKSRPSGE